MADEEPVTVPTQPSPPGPGPHPGRARRRNARPARPGITPANSPEPIPAIMYGPVAPLYLTPPPGTGPGDDATGDRLAAEAPAGATGIKQAGLTADGRPRARATVNRRQRPAASSAGRPSSSTAGPPDLP
ncbi:MAG: hypothetical protein QOC94_3995 [Actinoplanes sp.]|nr:hypothetical protein [Actinoplanes sp.]